MWCGIRAKRPVPQPWLACATAAAIQNSIALLLADSLAVIPKGRCGRSRRGSLLSSLLKRAACCATYKMWLGWFRRTVRSVMVRTEADGLVAVEYSCRGKVNRRTGVGHDRQREGKGQERVG